MNLMKELQKLDGDSLTMAIGRMTNNELLGLLRPIAQTPVKWRGPSVTKMYNLISQEMQGRNPAKWIEISKDLERFEARAARIEPYLAGWKK
jgi:hypothetical protein